MGGSFNKEYAKIKIFSHSQAKADSFSKLMEYSMTFKNVFESEKLSKTDLVELCCKTMHCVRLRCMEHGPEDGLYVIFGNRAGQDAAFMHRWLHCFVTEANCKNFIRARFNYLARKGLDIDLWAKSIIDGRKPDFLVLFALNVLVLLYL